MRHQTTTPHLKSCATGSIAAVAGCNGSHGGGGGLDKVGVLRPGERQDVNASCKIPQRGNREGAGVGNATVRNSALLWDANRGNFCMASRSA